MVPTHTADDSNAEYLQSTSFEEVLVSSEIAIEDDVLARFPNSSSRSSRPVSESSTASVRVPRHEQERTRSEYLQAQGFAPALSRSSADSGGSSSRTDVSEKVRAIQRRLNALPQLQNEVVGSVVSGRFRSDVNYIQGLGSFNTSRRDDCEASCVRASDLQGPMAVSCNDITAAPNRYRLRKGFKAARDAEAGNWYTARGSKTLPHRFASIEATPGSSLSMSKSSRTPLADFELSTHIPTERSSRAASLRIRNSRLPPGYALPKDSAALIVASASLQDRTDRTFEGLSESVSPRRHSAAHLIPYRDDSNTDALRMPPRGLTVDTAISSELTFLEALDRGSQRNSRLSDTSEELNPGDRPEVPPKSPDRLSVRDRTLLSNRGSLVWPIPEPAEPPPLVCTAPQEAIQTKKKSGAWRTDFVFAVLWAVLTGLTVFGISNTSRLHPRSAHALGKAKPCTAPSLSFVHNLRMTTTLPEILQPYLPSFQLDDIDVDVADHGLKLHVYNSESGQQLQIYGGLVIGTAFAESRTRLLSNITYAGFVDGGQDEAEARRLLGAMLKEARAGRSGEALKSVSAQSARRNVTVLKDGKSIGAFLALWLACLLAVEASLLVDFVVFRVVWHAAMWCCQDRRLNSEESDAVEQSQMNWKQKLLTTSTLALQWVLVSALGSALAGGVLMAFCT